MFTYSLKDKYGKSFQVTLAPAYGVSGNSWRRIHFNAGQAGPMLQRFGSLQLESLRTHFSNRSLRIAITPLNSLTSLFEAGILTLYEQSLSGGTQGSLSKSKNQTVAEMSLDIEAEFRRLLIVQGVSASSQTKEGGGKGALDSGQNLKTWLNASTDVCSPLWHIKRQIDSALDDYNRQAAARSPSGDLGLMANYLRSANIRDYKIVVNALGIDPNKIDANDFSTAWHKAWVLAGDPSVSQMIRKFSLAYMGVPSHPDFQQAKLTAVFEVLLAILLTTNTETGKTPATNINTPNSGVLVRVAEKLLKMSTQVVERPRPFKSDTKKTTAKKAEAPPKAPEPPPEPAQAKPTPKSDPLENTQAQTLIDAAKNGTPFCEECEKLKNAA
jgi:hypothetical protein